MGMYMSSQQDSNQVKTNTPHLNISIGIIQSLQKVWNDHEFEDFIVSVDGEIFSCHSLILASCSEFFRGLLRSNMREKKEMRVELNNISPSTFQIIVNSLYSGCDFLTKENVTDVWSAVHQLQIQFLIEHCEEFVIKNLSLDTVEMYKEKAEYLQSENVKEYIFNFILNNFENLRHEDIFLHLDFDYLMRLVQSDKLKVDSEDSVLCSIVDWVQYGNDWSRISNSIEYTTTNEDVLQNTLPAVISTENSKEQSRENPQGHLRMSSIARDTQGFSENQDISSDRKHALVDLIKASRYYLASEVCILKLSQYKLLESDNLVKEIVLKALNFKFCENCHSYCPTPAINRDCSHLEHVGVYCDEQRIRALSFKRKKDFHLQYLPLDLDATITVVSGQLYICLLGIAPTKVYKLHKNGWVRVTEVAHAVELFLAHGTYIFALDTIGKQISFFQPEHTPINIKTVTHDIDNLTYALGFHNNLVAFSSEVNNGIEETVVHSWNIETKLKSKHDNLKLSPQNLQSFRDDTNTYILDDCGNLWKLVNSDTIGFSFVAKLWTGKYNMKGAILFRETLHLLVECPGRMEVVDGCGDVFSTIIIWAVGENASSVLHYTVPKMKRNTN